MLPRWRGFNLLENFTMKSDGQFREDDFRWIADWGFDFVRLPMCYRLWIKGDDVFSVDEAKLVHVDRAVEFGRKYRVHVDLNFHRAPGYTVNRELPAEPFDLWKDTRALEAFCFHWEMFARRYRGISSDELSFNLVNEPVAPAGEPAKGMTRADHERVVRAVVAAIRKVDPDRLILADGLSWGNLCCPELADLKIAQSCRAYLPGGISHYKAHWVKGEDWAAPTWPGALRWPNTSSTERWGRKELEAHYLPWIELARQGVGVHCGEGGAYCFTPHDVFLRWWRDVMEILKAANIGYALWNFRGPFGILDSNRADVAYADWHGHKLDQKLLDLLREF